MTTAPTQISNLLEKMVSADKDFRFMATNDLMTELQKDSIKLDDDIERRITKALLRLLDDKNGEVQNLAVKCLAPLIAKAKALQIELVVEQLCQNIETNQERLRDVSSIALKTVVNELSPTGNVPQVPDIIAKILPKLLHVLRSDRRNDSSIKIEVMDIVGIIVNKFNRVNGIDFAEIEEVLFLQLEKERQALRKRAITVLGFLVDAVDERAYEVLVQRVLNGLRKTTDPASIRAYVHAAATISKTPTCLFVNHIGEFVDLLVAYCNKTDDDELKDACLHAFDTFICRCDKEIVPHVPVILELCTKLIKYDPNYTYDAEAGDDDDSMEVDGSDADEDSDVEDYSDDDDVSWKARRSAAKCVESLITSRSDRLLENYEKLAPLLLTRFKEREESVKIDIFHAYEALLKQTRLFLPDRLANLDVMLQQSLLSSDGQRMPAFSKQEFERILNEDVDDQQRAVLRSLFDQVPQLVRAISKQLKSKSSNVRLQSFQLLISLLRALPGALDGHFEFIMPAVKTSVMEKASDSSTKIDTLQFLHIALVSHEPAVFTPHLDTLIKLVTSSVNEPFYKVGSVALLVLQSLIIVLRKLADAKINLGKHVETLYEICIGKLRLGDVDQEVKERSIASAGMLFSSFGTCLSHHLDEMLPLLIDRMRNEMSRHVAVQTFLIIVSGTDQVPLERVLPELLQLLAEFLRKNQRALRVSTLSLLSALVTKYKLSELPAEGVKRVIVELPASITDSDAFISQLGIKLAREIVARFPDAMSESVRPILQSCVTLARSSTLIGRSLDYAVELFVAIVKSPIPSKPVFTEIMDELTNAMRMAERPSRQMCIATATIMAHSIRANNDATTTIAMLQRLVELSRSTNTDNNLQAFALYTLGEIGRVFPAAYDSVSANPESIIMESFNSSTEDTKTVASYALGGLASGNVPKYLPVLLKEIKSNVKYQYLLLHALKEVIDSENMQAEVSGIFENAANEIWNVLLKHSKTPEESTRNVVAECMGKLCKIAPTTFIPELIKLSSSTENLERGTAATAVRFMIVDWSSRAAEDFLRSHLGQLLHTIDDSDLNVRRTTIMTLNSTAHNKPRWVKELLPTILPSLYRETIVKKELIYEVEMGPFKHVVDDGLDLRKSAYECMYTLMEHCLDRIDIPEYMNHMENGLKDQHDIKLLNLLMLTRLAQTCSTQVAQRIDRFVDLIVPMLSMKPRSNSVKQEIDKLEELKRACTRTLQTIKRIPALERSIPPVTP